MMKNLAILGFLLLPMHLSAQGPIQKINSIKMSDDYIYEQAALGNADSALVRAAGNLAIDVRHMENESVTGEELLPHLKHILQKGKTKVRAFVYIKKADVKGAVAAILKKRGQGAEAPVEASEAQAPAFTADPFAQSIMEHKDIYAVRDYFESCMKSGDIARYGSPKNAGNMDDKHLVLFNGEGLEPICVLSPVREGGERQNLIDGSSDSLGNHHGCYAIWFTIKE